MIRKAVLSALVLCTLAPGLALAKPKGKVDIVECSKVRGFDARLSVLIQFDLETKKNIATVKRTTVAGQKVFGVYTVAERTTACGPRCLGAPTVYVGKGFELTVYHGQPHGNQPGMSGQLIAEQSRGARINESVSCQRTR